MKLCSGKTTFTTSVHSPRQIRSGANGRETRTSATKRSTSFSATFPAAFDLGSKGRYALSTKVLESQKSSARSQQQKFNGNVLHDKISHQCRHRRSLSVNNGLVSSMNDFPPEYQQRQSDSSLWRQPKFHHRRPISTSQHCESVSQRYQSVPTDGGLHYRSKPPQSKPPISSCQRSYENCPPAADYHPSKHGGNPNPLETHGAAENDQKRGLALKVRLVKELSDYSSSMNKQVGQIISTIVPLSCLVHAEEVYRPYLLSTDSH